jgi:hypothetical protein
MTDDEFMTLYKAGKFKEALASVTGPDPKAKYTPSRYAIDKRVNKPIFYRGNKRVAKDENGEWQLSKHKFEFDD